MCKMRRSIVFGLGVMLGALAAGNWIAYGQEGASSQTALSDQTAGLSREIADYLLAPRIISVRVADLSDDWRAKLQQLLELMGDEEARGRAEAAALTPEATLKAMRLPDGDGWTDAFELVLSTPSSGEMWSWSLARSTGPRMGVPATLGELQSLADSVKTYSDEGCALVAPYIEASAEDFAAARKEFTTPLLRGLALLLERGIPSERPALPAGSGGLLYVGPLDAPEYQAELKQHEEELAAHHRGMALLRLWMWRKTLTLNIIAYYSNAPYATDELRQLATEILEDPAVVAEMVAAVEANIAERTNALSPEARQAPMDQATAK